MSETIRYWQKPEMVASRKAMITEEGYEEFEGCKKCITERCLEKHCGYTMDWRVVPPRKCKKHPKYFVEKALLHA